MRVALYFSELKELLIIRLTKKPKIEQTNIDKSFMAGDKTRALAKAKPKTAKLKIEMMGTK